MLQMKVLQNYIYEKLCGCTSLSSPLIELGGGGLKAFFKSRNGKQVLFKAECCKKYRLYQKKLQTKVLKNYIAYKKLNRHTSISHWN